MFPHLPEASKAHTYSSEDPTPSQQREISTVLETRSLTRDFDRFFGRIWGILKEFARFWKILNRFEQRYCAFGTIDRLSLDHCISMKSIVPQKESNRLHTLHYFHGRQKSACSDPLNSTEFLLTLKNPKMKHFREIFYKLLEFCMKPASQSVFFKVSNVGSIFTPKMFDALRAAFFLQYHC